MSPAPKHQDNLLKTERQQTDSTLHSNNLTELEGSWEQRRDDQQTCLLNIKAMGPDMLSLKVKVGNTLSCTVVRKKGVLCVGKITSTKLLIPSYMHAKETKLAKILAGLTELTDDGNFCRRCS